MSRRRRYTADLGTRPIGFRVPEAPPHPIDSPCCAKWWRAHRALAVDLKVLDTFGVIGNPRLLLMYADKLPRAALRLAAQRTCPCRTAANDTPHPAALVELFGLAANGCPPGADPLDHLERLAREVCARRGIEIPASVPEVTMEEPGR